MSCEPCTDPCAQQATVWLVKQGALFWHRIKLVRANGSRFDLTGFTVRCQFRRGTFESTTAAVAEATCTVVDATRGIVDVKLGATITKQMFDFGVFDVEATNDIDPDEVYRFLSGTWTTSLEATLDGP